MHSKNVLTNISVQKPDPTPDDALLTTKASDVSRPLTDCCGKDACSTVPPQPNACVCHDDGGGS